MKKVEIDDKELENSFKEMFERNHKEMSVKALMYTLKLILCCAMIIWGDKIVGYIGWAGIIISL